MVKPAARELSLVFGLSQEWTNLRIASGDYQSLLIGWAITGYGRWCRKRSAEGF